MPVVFSFEETPDSRISTVNPPTVTLRYKAVGEPNDATVVAFAIAGTPTSVFTPVGQLWRQDVKVDPDGYAQYKVTVTYGLRNRETNSFTFNFDTTGATTKVKIAREHLGTYYSPSQPHSSDTNPHHGSIGVKQDQDVEGCEIIIPNLKIGVIFRFPQSSITIAKVKQFASVTGMTNSDEFLGFDPGELLFLGATGSDGSNAELEVNFQFAASQNASSLTFGDIVGIVKTGHAYAWVEFVTDKTSDSKAATVPPLAVHVERVYDTASFHDTLFNDGAVFH